MKCPNDDSVLVMSDRSGIEIDYCPQCRGVWLDRGELDKIIERSLGPSEPNPPQRAAQSDSRPRDDHRPDYRHDPYKKRKKESFLGDLFDF